MFSNIRFIFLAILFFVFTFVMLGCGGGSNMTSSTTPSPGSANPAPQPTPVPTPTPMPGTNAGMFQAALLNNSGASVGQVQVNASANNGAGMMSLSGGPANASLTLQFWPFDPDTYGKGGAPAYTVTTVMTDASGNAQATFQYPKSGVFFGNFRLFQGTTDVADAGFNDSSSQSNFTSTPDYHAAILRASETTDVSWATFTLGNDPIGTGTFSIHGSVITVNITGAVADSTYDMTLCPGMTGSGCYDAGTFKTDATGSANTTVDLLTTAAAGYTPAGETFFMTRGNSLQYVVGFKVP